MVLSDKDLSNLWILGVGQAKSRTLLGNAQIESFGTHSAADEHLLAGNFDRACSLPRSYLEKTGNESSRDGFLVAEDTPTSLGVAAVEDALARAGLESGDIDLVIGASSTPSQTTPSEAQRVAGNLGLKVPAYDLACGFADLVVQIRSLYLWRKDEMPGVVVCLSSNTPTQRINYRVGAERWIFEDRASAVVLSRKQRGAFRVAAVDWKPRHASRPLFSIPRYGTMRLDLDEATTWATQARPEATAWLKQFVGAGPVRTMSPLLPESLSVFDPGGEITGRAAPSAIGADPFYQFSLDAEGLATAGAQTICLPVVGPGYGYGAILLSSADTRGR